MNDEETTYTYGGPSPIRSKVKDEEITYAYDDDEMKNYYLQARYYNPAIGSFLALDPHPGDDDEPLSQNGYIYTSGNPVMKVDPNGLLDVRTRDIAGAINAAIVLIPYLGPLQRAMKAGVKKKVKKIMDKNRTVEKLTRAIHKGLIKLKVKTAKVRKITLMVASIINAFVGYSIGQAVVFILKSNFKVITKYKKVYYLFGKKEKYEYIRERKIFCVNEKNHKKRRPNSW